MITHLTIDQIQPMIDASAAEGYRFIESLWQDYEIGRNRFAGNGEALLGAYDGGQLVAVGGIQTDPYIGLPTIGRIRHVYVMPTYRRQGTGAALVRALIAHAVGYFTTVTLRTPTDHGRAFYEALDFSDAPRFADSTHWLDAAES